MMFYISKRFHENILKGFQVIELTRLCDGQMDKQTTEAKTISSPLSGGDIII